MIIKFIEFGKLFYIENICDPCLCYWVSSDCLISLNLDSAVNADPTLNNSNKLTELVYNYNILSLQMWIELRRRRELLELLDVLGRASPSAALLLQILEQAQPLSCYTGCILDYVRLELGSGHGHALLVLQLLRQAAGVTEQGQPLLGDALLSQLALERDPAALDRLLPRGGGEHGGRLLDLARRGQYVLATVRLACHCAVSFGSLLF